MLCFARPTTRENSINITSKPGTQITMNRLNQHRSCIISFLSYDLQYLQANFRPFRKQSNGFILSFSPLEMHFFIFSPHLRGERINFRCWHKKKSLKIFRIKKFCHPLFGSCFPLGVFTHLFNYSVYLFRVFIKLL